MTGFTTVALASLGCKVNQSEIEQWQREFADQGFRVVPFDEPADAYVLNTCSVTHVADRKSRQLLRQAARRNPSALLVATGCYATVSRERVQTIEGVDLVVTQADKPDLVGRVITALGSNSRFAARSLDGVTTTATRGGRTRALVKAADGCDKFCAFCIVPYARGRSVSYPLSHILDNVRAAIDAGFREIVLTSVNLGVYGRDLQRPLSTRDLIESVLTNTSVERLRVSSIEPDDFDPSILELWRSYPDRLCRHFHLALDSGCDATLKRMRRRYTQATYADSVREIRTAVPGASITTDVMVGYPGETDAEFAESADFVWQMGFAQVHVFRYSPRPGTAGAALPDHVPDLVSRDRLDAMLKVSDDCASRFRGELIGEYSSVLFESRLEDADTPTWDGLTDNYVRVYVESARALANQIVKTRLTGVHAEGMTGEVVSGG